LNLKNQDDTDFLSSENHHQRGAAIMAQGVLSFKYEEAKRETGMTGLAGLPVYLDLASVRDQGLLNPEKNKMTR
jgi:hypothetical protein